jgi:hypothetical protein
VALISAQVAVADTATKIFDPAANSQFIIVENATGNDDVFLGGSGVTIATGYRLTGGGILTLNDIGKSDVLYGVVSAGSETVTVLKSSVGE